MTTALRTTPNSIAAPFTKGARVRIPKGTIIKSLNPGQVRYRPAGRTMTVTVHHVLDGHVDLWNDYKHGRGYVILPTIAWPGSGGYWQEAQFTPALAIANNLLPAPLPTFDSHDLARLDTLPDYGDGYANHWVPGD